MTLSLRADVLSAGGVEAHSVVVEGGYEAGRLDLRRLSVADLAGASIDARRQHPRPARRPSGRIEASVSGRGFQRRGRIPRELRAGKPARGKASKAVAPILSPVRAEVSAEAARPARRSRSSDRQLRGNASDAAGGRHGHARRPRKHSTGRSTLHADGEDSADGACAARPRAAAGAVGPAEGRCRFRRPRWPKAERSSSPEPSPASISTYAAETALADGTIALSGDVRRRAAPTSIRLFFSPGWPCRASGRGTPPPLPAGLSWPATSLSLALKEGSFAGQAVGGSLKAGCGGEPRLSGALDLEPASLPFLAALAAGYVPGVDGGAWSDTAFAPALPPDLASTLRSRPRRSTSARLSRRRMRRWSSRFADGALNLDLVEAGFAGGKLKGAVAATMRDGEAAASLRGELTGGQLQALVWERTGLPVASGKLDVSFEAAGSGRSMAGIVATLGGSGSFAVERRAAQRAQSAGADGRDGGRRGRGGAGRGGGARDLRQPLRFRRVRLRPRRRLVRDLGRRDERATVSLEATPRRSSPTRRSI